MSLACGQHCHWDPHALHRASSVVSDYTHMHVQNHLQGQGQTHWAELWQAPTGHELLEDKCARLVMGKCKPLLMGEAGHQDGEAGSLQITAVVLQSYPREPRRDYLYPGGCCRSSGGL